MTEEILNTINDNLQNSETKVLKLKQIYLNNKRNEYYTPNFNYSSYEDEIIKGESVLDCLLENVKWEEKILKDYEKLLKQTKEMKYKPMEYLKKIEIIEKKYETNIEQEIEEQENNFDEIEETII